VKRAGSLGNFRQTIRTHADSLKKDCISMKSALNGTMHFEMPPG
jgi:hypothetical protein